MPNTEHPITDARREWAWVAGVAACVVASASLPYVIVYLTTPPDLRFVGTLLNPLDGDTYLAKMQFGAQGDWLFHLPYTAQDHPGAFVLTHYLALGHVAAWTRCRFRWCITWRASLAGFRFAAGRLCAHRPRDTRPDRAAPRVPVRRALVRPWVGWL